MTEQPNKSQNFSRRSSEDENERREDDDSNEDQHSSGQNNYNNVPDEHPIINNTKNMEIPPQMAQNPPINNEEQKKANSPSMIQSKLFAYKNNGSPGSNHSNQFPPLFNNSNFGQQIILHNIDNNTKISQNQELNISIQQKSNLENNNQNNNPNNQNNNINFNMNGNSEQNNIAFQDKYINSPKINNNNNEMMKFNYANNGNISNNNQIQNNNFSKGSSNSLNFEKENNPNSKQSEEAQLNEFSIFKEENKPDLENNQTTLNNSQSKENNFLINNNNNGSKNINLSDNFQNNIHNNNNILSNINNKETKNNLMNSNLNENNMNNQKSKTYDNNNINNQNIISGGGILNNYNKIPNNDPMTISNNNMINNQNNNKTNHSNYNKFNNNIIGNSNNIMPSQSNQNLMNKFNDNNIMNNSKNIIGNQSNNYFNNNISNNNQNNINLLKGENNSASNTNNMAHSNNINLNNINFQNNQMQNIAQPRNNYFSYLTQAPKTGLSLLGDTSYLNSVLQIIGNCNCLANYFLNPKYKKYIEENIKSLPLTFVIYRLFLHLYVKNDIREIYRPEAILYMLGELNCIYKSKNNSRRNPNELLSFILNQIHSETNKISNNVQVNNLNISDKNNVINAGKQNFMQNYNSKISKYFNWFEIKEIKCTICNNNFYFLNTYNMLELDILFASNYFKVPITIYDCLKIFESPKTFNSFCQNCKAQKKVLKFSKIYTSPNIFIFSLDRKNLDTSLLQIPFMINEEIDISNFVEENCPKNYKLTGIMSYSPKNKSYVSFCISPVDNKWYFYYNENVELKNINEIIDLHNNQHQYIPCLLVYNSPNIWIK